MRPSSLYIILFSTLLTLACKDDETAKPKSPEESKATSDHQAPEQKDDKAQNDPEIAVGKGASPQHPAASMPMGTMKFDMDLLGELAGEFDSTLALLKRGSPETGQGSLTIFGPGFESGDKGVAKDWTDICATRLNAFSPKTTGIFLDLNKIEPWPAEATSIKTGRSFQLQGKGKKLPYSAFKDTQLESDIRILGDGVEVEVLIHVEQPESGALLGRVTARVCPSS